MNKKVAVYKPLRRFGIFPLMHIIFRYTENIRRNHFEEEFFMAKTNGEQATKELDAAAREELINTLKERFEENIHRHENFVWAEV